MNNRRRRGLQTSTSVTWISSSAVRVQVMTDPSCAPDSHIQATEGWLSHGAGVIGAKPASGLVPIIIDVIEQTRFMST